jgi:imidazolonepropionase-like amidohydrolase
LGLAARSHYLLGRNAIGLIGENAHLRMATGDNGELMALSGFINPYPGKLGVVEEGALADLLLVDDNPLENIKLIEGPETNFLVIMKDGKLYKNTLPN